MQRSKRFSNYPSNIKSKNLLIIASLSSLEFVQIILQLWNHFWINVYNIYRAKFCSIEPFRSFNLCFLLSHINTSSKLFVFIRHFLCGISFRSLQYFISPEKYKVFKLIRNAIHQKNHRNVILQIFR